MTQKKIILFVLMFVCAFALDAQSIVGTWKRTGNVLEKADGTKKDMLIFYTKAKPCMLEIKYVFQADGKQLTQWPAGCELIKFTEQTTWKMEGDKIIMKTNAYPFETTYTLAFKGNTVNFTHTYTAPEKEKLHTQYNKIVITYQRI